MCTLFDQELAYPWRQSYLLLVTFATEAIRVLGMDFQPFAFLSLIPLISGEPALIHRWITAAWLHSGWIHVLGNVLVIALVGVPLEQKLGPNRWIAIYLLGLLVQELDVGPHSRRGSAAHCRSQWGGIWITGGLHGLLAERRD